MIRRRWMQLPKLIRFMLIRVANGMVTGCAFLFVLIWLDFAGLGRLLAKDESGLATFVRFFQTALTFGSVSMRIAVMNLGEDRAPARAGGHAEASRLSRAAAELRPSVHHPARRFARGNALEGARALC
jgi:hypothetical protein